MGKRANGEGSWNFSSTKKLYTYRYTFPEGRKSFTGKTKAICLERFKAYQTYRRKWNPAADKNNSVGILQAFFDKNKRYDRTCNV